MKNIIPGILLALFTFGLHFGTSSAHASDHVDATKGDKYYTLFSLFYEDDHHITTNYRKGTLVPINTPVTFIKADEDKILVTISGKEIAFINVPEYSGEDIEGIFNRTFGKSPVSLDSFTDQEKLDILSGVVEVGMTKKAVILALGYPPKHRTPSLNSPQWRYWHNRFATFLVYFTNEKVSNIKE